MDWSVTQRQRLHSLLGVFFGTEVTAAILSLVRPALRLAGRDEPLPGGSPSSESRTATGGTATRTIMTSATPLEATRLGGAAALPPGLPWPYWDTRALDFLALVDFAELSAVHGLPGLPADGVAAFFYVSRIPRPWGDRPDEHNGWRVLPGATDAAEAPADALTHPELRLSAAPFLSLPAPGEPELAAAIADYSGVSEIYEQLYAAWSEHVWAGEPMHQIGGWPVPVPVQSPVPTGGDTVLLAQFDSDERLGWHWGDPGRVYFTLNTAQSPEQATLTLQAR